MHSSSTFMSRSAPVENSYYIYAPVKGVSIVFAILFLISGILHAWENNFKRRSFRIGFLLPWAALLFVAGYSLREYNAYHYDDMDTFIASNVLLFCAPPVYAGANYFILGRLLYYIPYLSPMHPGRVWTTFVALDTVVEILAGQGASRALNPSGTPSSISAGFALIKSSLILQLVLFAAFVSLVIIFHRRCLRAQVCTRPTKIIIYTLYATSLLIFIRNILRTAAFFYPWTDPINSTEWIIWVFEALPMLVCTYIMNIWPPAKYLPANNKIYLAKDGKTELEGPGAKADRRNFFVTILDPFDLVGLIQRRDNKNRFWEHDGIGGPKKEEDMAAAAAAAEV